MQQQAQQQKARDRAHHNRVISAQSRRRQQSQHHQSLQRPALPAPPPTSHTGERDDAIAEVLEPNTHATEGLDPPLVSQGMKKEVQQMKDQSVFTEIDGNTMTPEQRANIIKPRWVLKPTHNEARARTVAKGYTEPATDHDLLLASTPLFCTLRVLLTMALVYNWSICAGDVSFAFLHAAAISYNLVMRPPHEFYNEANRHIMWRQEHIAHILTVTLELLSCKTESNVTARSTS